MKKNKDALAAPASAWTSTVSTGLLNSLNSFAKRDFEKAQQQLKLLQNSQQQPQQHQELITALITIIQHNLLITQYYQKLKDPDQFIDELLKLLNATREQLYSCEFGDSSAAHVNNGNAVNNGNGNNNNNNSNTKAVAIALQKSLDALTYNAALLFYKYNRNERAEQLLRPLFEMHRIDKMEENLSLRSCLLLLDIYLSHASISNVERIATLVEYTEKTFRAIFESKPSASSPALLAQQHNKNQPNAQQPTTTTSPPQVSLNELNALRLVNQLNLNDAKLYLHLQRARFHILINNLQQADKDLAIAFTITQGNSNNSNFATILQAQVRFYQHRHSESLNTLNNLSVSPSIVTSAISKNNLACIIDHLQKPNIASVLLQNAIQSCNNNVNNNSNNQKDQTPKMLYNLGLQYLLQQGKPELAYKCFASACYSMYNNPRVWIRMAECIISVQHDILQNQFEAKNVNIHTTTTTTTRTSSSSLPNQSSSLDSPRISHVTLPIFDVFSGVSQPVSTVSSASLSSASNLASAHASSSADEVLFALSPQQQKQTASQQQLTSAFGVNQNSLANDMSLNMADKCLRNALALLLNSQANIPLKHQDLFQQQVANFEQSIRQLIRHVYLKLAYVSLALENHVVALYYSKKLLNDKDAPKNVKITALCYAVESLCLSDKAKDALSLLSQLDKVIINAIQRETSASDSTWEKKCLHANIIVMYIMNGKLQQAQDNLNKFLLPTAQQQDAIAQEQESFKPAFLLQVYIYLAQGKVQEALHVIKENTRFTRLV